MAEPVPNPSDIPPFESGLWNRGWFMIVLCLAFIILDWEYVPLVIFPFIFIFPLMLVAWNRRMWFATLCTALLSVSRVAHQFIFDSKPGTIDDYADALIRFFVLLLLALLTNQLGRQSRQLRRRVRLLEGILPICSSCKSIRDENNNWVQLEGYITAHTTAQFSHSLCPHCFKEFYGEEPASSPAAK